jgi:hypothetical protein
MYTEVGWGNSSFITTEVEGEKGEYRIKGVLTGRFISLYLRIWVGRKVLILDSVEGVKIQDKSRDAFKVLVGIHWGEV